MIHSPQRTIETSHLLLISCDEEILKAILSSDAAIAKLLDVNVASPWTEAGEPAFKFSLNRLADHPEETGWWTYLPILKEENLLIGSGGYKGKPDDQGMVEFGYEIARDYRGRGLATEMARAFVRHAFENPEVKIVQAHTLAEENASAKVLRNCGLYFVQEILDPVDGKLWKWEVRRNNHSQ